MDQGCLYLAALRLDTDVREWSWNLVTETAWADLVFPGNHYCFKPVTGHMQHSPFPLYR